MTRTIFHFALLAVLLAGSVLAQSPAGLYGAPSTGSATNKLDKPGSAGVVTVDGSGNASVVSGSASDCVKVNGTSGACGTLSSINGQTGAVIMTSDDIDFSTFPAVGLNYPALEGRVWGISGQFDFTAVPGVRPGGTLKPPSSAFASIPTTALADGQLTYVSNTTATTPCAISSVLCMNKSGTLLQVGPPAGTSVTPASPYWNVGGSLYLEDGSPATPPDQTGWTVPSNALFTFTPTATYGTNGNMMLAGTGNSNSVYGAMYKSGGSYRYMRARVTNSTVVSTADSICGMIATTSTFSSVIAIVADKHNTSDINRGYAKWGNGAAFPAGNNALELSCPTGAPMWLDLDLGSAAAANAQWRYSCDKKIWSTWTNIGAYGGVDPWVAASRSAFTHYGVIITQGNGVNAPMKCSVDTLTVSASVIP